MYVISKVEVKLNHTLKKCFNLFWGFLHLSKSAYILSLSKWNNLKTAFSIFPGYHCLIFELAWFQSFKCNQIGKTRWITEVSKHFFKALYKHNFNAYTMMFWGWLSNKKIYVLFVQSFVCFVVIFSISQCIMLADCLQKDLVDHKYTQRLGTCKQEWHGHIYFSVF